MNQAKVLANNLLKENKLCVIATASLDAKPQAATIMYAEDDFDLYFETFPQYRKYKNLKENPVASIVITKVPHTLQMYGDVFELNGREAERAKEKIRKKCGDYGVLNAPETKFFKFKASWSRVFDGNKKEYFVVKG